MAIRNLQNEHFSLKRRLIQTIPIVITQSSAQCGPCLFCILKFFLNLEKFVLLYTSLNKNHSLWGILRNGLLLSRQFFFSCPFFQIQLNTELTWVNVNLHYQPRITSWRAQFVSIMNKGSMRRTTTTPRAPLATPRSGRYTTVTLRVIPLCCDTEDSEFGTLVLTALACNHKRDHNLSHQLLVFWKNSQMRKTRNHAKEETWNKNGSLLFLS